MDLKRWSAKNFPAMLLMALMALTGLAGCTTPDYLDGNGNLTIPVAKVSEKAVFYPLEVEGVKMEVLAVKAPDGTIRTAFNTCQVCYSSGRGYYKQEQNALVCQNCGNRFTMEQVEVISGGCNPVPILPEYKTQDGENIVISGELLRAAKDIFSNWQTFSKA